MTGYVFSNDVLREDCDFSIKPIEVSQRPLLNIQQQQALMSLVKVDDPISKQQIIAHNLSLVVGIADHYRAYGVELIELVNEGIQGLIHALENFEREGGFRFAKYAARCVRQSIERAILSRNSHLSFASLSAC